MVWRGRGTFLRWPEPTSPVSIEPARRESSSWPIGPKLRDGRAEERKVIRAFRAGLVHCGASAGMPIRSWNRSVPFGFSADLPHEQSW